MATENSCEIIRLTAIDESRFVSSSVAETDYAVYDPATTYLSGSRVILTTGYHKVYESLQNGNLNHNPATALDASAWWAEVGPTNRWAMFDGVRATATTSATPIVVSFTPGRINRLYIDNTTASSINVQVTSLADGLVFDETFALEDEAVITDYDDYFFEEINRADSLLVLGLPPYNDCTVTVTISNGSAAVSCGLLLVGYATRIGSAEYGVTTGIIDYSKKITDPDTGRTTLSQGDFSSTINVRILLPGGQTDAVKRVLVQYRATPAILVVAGNLFKSLIAYGFYNDFREEIVYFNGTYCTLSWEGLT